MIPIELQKLDQWVCVEKDNKIPMKAWTYDTASSSHPDTWSDYQMARDAVDFGSYDYIGFVFNNNGLVGIDIDCGYEDGLLSETAADIIGKCHSYTEKSKSGRGFHVILRGTLPFTGRNNRRGVEIYQAARFFILTGDVLLYPDIIANQEAIDYVVARYFTDIPHTSHTIHGDRIYNPCWDKPMVGNKIPLRPKYSTINRGGRNVSLLSIGGGLLAQGYSKEQLIAELSRINTECCKPPLNESELKTICKSIMRYKGR